ncbi:sugar ABC transporter substrate-binding protein, partial [Streptomyces umbrinus]
CWPASRRERATSTYELPEYQKAAAAFGDITLKSIEQANPTDPGVQPRPTVGVQFVAVPEFQDLGTKVTQEISAAIAGKTSVDKALDKGQKLAEETAKTYQ